MLRGQALRTIKRLKLYRDRFDTFESYCDEVFGFTMLYIERCMLAAETYYQIESYLKTNGLEDPLPTKQRQLRPIFQADLTPIEAGVAKNLHQLATELWEKQQQNSENSSKPPSSDNPYSSNPTTEEKSQSPESELSQEKTNKNKGFEIIQLVMGRCHH